MNCRRCGAEDPPPDHRCEHRVEWMSRDQLEREVRESRALRKAVREKVDEMLADAECTPAWTGSAAYHYRESVEQYARELGEIIEEGQRS